MINVIVPIVEDVEGFSKFMENQKSKDVKFFVGVKSSLKDKLVSEQKNVEIHVFADTAKKEEIINSLNSCQLKKGKIVIVRRPLEPDEFHNLTTLNKDITIISSKKNSFLSKLKRFYGWIVRRFFAFSYIEDISAICFDEDLFELLSCCKDLSMATRINRYVGLEIGHVDTQREMVKREYNKVKNLLLLLLPSLFLVGSIVGAVLVCVLVKPIYVLTVVAAIFWITIALITWFVCFVNFARTVAVGDLRFESVEEIKEENKKGE